MAFIRGCRCGASIIDESLDNELGESQNKEPEDHKGWITSGREDEDFRMKEEMKMLLMLTPINEVLQGNNEENAPKKIENQMCAVHILRPGSLVVYNPPPLPPPPPFKYSGFKLPEGWEVEEVPRADASHIDKVHGPGADLDTLCVGPYNVRLEEFFSSLRKILAKMDEVTNLQTIMDPYVPVMKFKFQGILINLVYAPIYLRVVPNMLKLADEKAQISTKWRLFLLERPHLATSRLGCGGGTS